MSDVTPQDDSAASAAPAEGDEGRLPAVRMGLSLLTTLFDETDTVLFRPIETWKEGDRKKSHVHYDRIAHLKATRKALGYTLLGQIRFAEKTPINIFYGVCPRFNGNGRYDFAWQIRTVRALWTDIDHVTVEEALEKVEQAKLPRPSAVVATGHGVHLYWLLAEPYLIDDVGDPPAVLDDWRTGANGKKKTHKYILEDGERVYLDQRPLVAQLSPKALAVQNTLAGIAEAVGGDHTIDLARLLRVPGTMNRKDQRNGKKPVPCVLVECDPERRYPLAAFDSFKGKSAESKRAEQIAQVRLPTPKKMSASKSDKLAQRVTACAIAEPGERSDADFALCCFAIRNGVATGEVWGLVQGVGKFAERGESYFNLTWANAEQLVRVTLLDDLRKAPRPTPQSRTIDAADAGGFPTDDPESVAPNSSHDRPTIVVEAATTPLGTTLGQMTAALLQRGDYFVRADQLVQIQNDEIKPLLTAAELAGRLSRHVEFYFVDEEEGAYKPLPANYANTWLNNPSERGQVPAITLFTRNPVYTDDWRLVAPGHDRASGIYYAGPPITPREGTATLDALLADFCFATTADRTNYIGMLLTVVLIARFIGSKPAALFNGNQAELGKSILAQIIAILRDGRQAETASYNPNDEEFEKRLGATVRRGDTTIIIDNAKARGRNPRIDSACLERSITDQVLSFRLLGESATIRAENSHIFCITANSAEVSRDLLTRSVVVNLLYEGDPKRRKFAIADPEGYALEHRTELLGELLNMVERWKAAGMPRETTQSRFNKRGWGDIVGGILETCGEYDFLGNAEEAALALDETQRDFAELVGLLVDHAQPAFPPKDLVSLCIQHSLLVADLGEGSLRSLATKMGTLAGRFVNEQFTLDDGRKVTFKRGTARKGAVYHVQVGP